MKKMKNFRKKIFRLAFRSTKMEEIVWNDLKKLVSESNWHSKINEKEKCIECLFEISDKNKVVFLYYMQDGYFNCNVRIIEENTLDLTEDFFHLTAHFNTIFNLGLLNIYVARQTIEYQSKTPLIVPFLIDDGVYLQIINHFNASKDIYSAFERLINERESPVVIIGDLLRKIPN